MTLDQIKQAIEAGKTVHWANDGYLVIKDCIGQYLIIWDRGGHRESCIGLTWQDGITLNGRPDQFYINHSLHDFLRNIAELDDYAIAHMSPQALRDTILEWQATAQQLLIDETTT